MTEAIRIVVAFPLPFYTPLWVGRRIGAFEAEGLAVTVLVPPPGGTVDLIQRGEAEVALGGVMRSFVLADRGGPLLTAIAEVNSRDGFLLLSRTPAERFTWRNLERGRLILFGEAPTPWMCLQSVLRQRGVDPARLSVIQGLSVADATRAFLAGEGDYLETAQPNAEELLASGKAHLAAAMAGPVGHVPYSSLVVTREFRRERPETCAAVVRGLARTFQWMSAQKPGIIADLITSDFPAIEGVILRKVVARFQAAGTWPSHPSQDREAFDRLGRMLVDGGLIRTAAPYEDLVDDSFAQAVSSA
jgi:NitT/TauT family transport system substrate-binding protein